MHLIFRIRYHTVPSQSLWLKFSISDQKKDVTWRQAIPMRWKDEETWEAEFGIDAEHPLEIRYCYQLRKENYGATLDEWKASRFLKLDPSQYDAQVVIDDWCSAGTVDHLYETHALRHAFPERMPFNPLSVPEGANHFIQLHMAAVPEGHVPCLIGSVSEIGDWNWHLAVRLQEISANVWQAALYLPADWQIEYKYGLFDTSLRAMVSIESGENRRLAPRHCGSRPWIRVSDEAYRRDSFTLYRAAGVAIPVFSLRSQKSLGVGEFADLKPFADWSQSAGFKFIQILPINDTTSSNDWTDSYPYSAISVSALHPIYLRIEDVDLPMNEAFLEELSDARERLNALPQVDYESVMEVKTSLIRRLYEENHRSIVGSERFGEFLTENAEWVIPYAAFCLLRDRYETADFSCWGEWERFDAEKIVSLIQLSHPDWPEIAYHVWLQSELDVQLSKAVAYLHSKGISLKGDLPIGIDRKSVDAWASPQLFHMNAQAGAPPDAFAIKGQNWEFPTYNWKAMRQDNYRWWRSRFAHLGRYFDAYRIDHILGFFRIWQIPYEQTEGIMGWFEPAMPVHVDEFRARGISFDFGRYCKPYIRESFLREIFENDVEDVKIHYLEDCGFGDYKLLGHVENQRRIVEHFATWEVQDDETRFRMERLRDGLLNCASEVLFHEVPQSGGMLFHPRCMMRETRSFRELDEETQERLDALYVDYFYRRQEEFWEARGLEKLPAMRGASSMLLCGEDLGMVPSCVPEVLRELGILSLEIQRMPKNSNMDFSNPADAPYASVVSPSTHDMSTLRAWWRENARVTEKFCREMLGREFSSGELSGEMAGEIIGQHLRSPAMLAVFPLQDLLAMDEKIRRPDPEAERINVPAIMPYYWRYRMHLDVEKLQDAVEFNEGLRRKITEAGRRL